MTRDQVEVCPLSRGVMLTIRRRPGCLNRLVLAVTASALASAAGLTGVAALSPGLRTSPACPESVEGLPATHAWVGYGWQNNRLYHSNGTHCNSDRPRCRGVSITQSALTTAVSRCVQVQGDKSPGACPERGRRDGDWVYWSTRLGRDPNRPSTATTPSTTCA